MSELGLSISWNPSIKHSFQFLDKCPVEKLGLVSFVIIFIGILISSNMTGESLQLLITEIS